MKKLFFILIIFGTYNFLFATKIFAIDNWNEGYQISHGQTKEVVTGNADCHKVYNGAASDLFVPTKTATEWNAFAAYVPSGVTISSCITCAWNYDCTYQCYVDYSNLICDQCVGSDPYCTPGCYYAWTCDNLCSWSYDCY